MTIGASSSCPGYVAAESFCASIWWLPPKESSHSAYYILCNACIFEVGCEPQTQNRLLSMYLKWQNMCVFPPNQPLWADLQIRFANCICSVDIMMTHLIACQSCGDIPWRNFSSHDGLHIALPRGRYLVEQKIHEHEAIEAAYEATSIASCLRDCK